MKLTPLDIRRQEFKRVVRGIDPEEVSVFLDMVAGEYERVLREGKALSEELEGYKRKVEEFDGMKEAIQGAVVMAKKGADDALNQAKKEAELKLKEAEVGAERLLEDARRQAALVKKEMSDLRNQRTILISRMKSLLDGQMRILEAYVGDWDEESREMRLASEGADEVRAAEGASVSGASNWLGSAGSHKTPWGPELIPPTDQTGARDEVGASDSGGGSDTALREKPAAPDAPAGQSPTTEAIAERRPAHATERAHAAVAADSAELIGDEEKSGMDESIASPGRPDLIRFLRGTGPLRPGPLNTADASDQVRPLRPPRPTVNRPTGGHEGGDSG